MKPLLLLTALLLSGAVSAAADDLGATPLHDAVWLGQLETVRSLVAGGADVNARHLEGGSTPLHFAAAQGRAEIALLLIEHGADVNAATKYGDTALAIAIRRADQEIMNILLGHGAATDGALLLATQPATLALLLERATFAQAQLNARLTRAIDDSDLDAAKLLLAKGADATAAGLLHKAVRQGSIALTTLLLDAGAKADARDALGVPAIHEAALLGHADLVKLLARHGAAVDATDPASGSTPLYAAASMGKTDAVRALLELGADKAIRSSGGRTPLEAAVASGFSDAAKLLR
jgi:ankyrin repeat protein